jgi:hypothetical protein
MNLRKTVSQKSPHAEERCEKYTTNFIEEKLRKRKLLMDQYTFKKAATEHKHEPVLTVEDFHVDGWEMEQNVTNS